MADLERICRRIVFHGRVQGVGFRYTARSIAKRFPVEGYVKNLPDGTVELVAAGLQRDVNNFLAEIEQHFRDNINETEVKDLHELPFDRTGGFSIRT